MIPSPATMLKNLEQRTASNFLMENLLQRNTAPDSELSLTLNNWAASWMACQRDKEKTGITVNNIGLHKRLRRHTDSVDDYEENGSVRIDVDMETETEPETDGEFTSYHEQLTQIRLTERIKVEDNHLQDDEQVSRDVELDRDWVGCDNPDPLRIIKITSETEERISIEDNYNRNFNDGQFDRDISPINSFASSTIKSSRTIQTKEKPELKFGVKAILADDYERRRNSENFQTLQQTSGSTTVSTTGYSHSLQGSPPIQVNYAVGITKPIARPTAYHPHHPTHPSHPTGPTQHHFTAHAHHTLQLLACRGPYLTISNPANGPHLSGTTTITGGTFSNGMQPNINELANMNICFPWSGSARGRPRKGMMRRAVFSDTQRRGLEKKFQSQKYISKPDRKKLAERLGLKDSQVCLKR
ncbi:GSCOCG00012019001-RA-CDS [Cotesia congregata]|nr:GSCOCG00012019001-RA-CDS [Cotesia congregata]